MTFDVCVFCLVMRQQSETVRRKEGIPSDHVSVSELEGEDLGIFELSSSLWLGKALWLCISL